MVQLGTLLKRTIGHAARRVAPIALCALAVAACGSQPKQPRPTTTTAGKPPRLNDHTVYIYSSLPLSGPQRIKSLQVQQGIEFALKEAGPKVGAGGFQIRYRHLDDAATPPARRRHGRRAAAKPTSSTFNATATWRNAEAAARNPQTVAFVGDLDSGATELSLPILNQAGIVQLTPGSGYPGLTDSYNAKYGITQTGEPAKYYPQPQDHTLFRLTPNDIVQAAAADDMLSSAGCQRFSAWNFANTTESGALLNAVIQTAPKYRLTYVPPPKLPPATKDYGDYALTLSHAGGIHCALLVGHVNPAAVWLTWELHEQLPPGSPIIGTDGFCNSSWLNGLTRARAKSVAAALYCTTPALPLTAYGASGTDFDQNFQSTVHRSPSAYDFYGYAAAQLVIRAVKDIAAGEDPRMDVTTSLIQDVASSELNLADGERNLADERNLAYPFTFNTHGDLLSFSTYGIDDFADGSPKPYKTVTPRHLLMSAG